MPHFFLGILKNFYDAAFFSEEQIIWKKKYRKKWGTRSVHNFFDMDPFWTRLEPLESPEFSFSNGIIFVQNGSLLKKLHIFPSRGIQKDQTQIMILGIDEKVRQPSEIFAPQKTNAAS